MADVEISLTNFEKMLASFAGVMRQVENLKNRKRPMYGAGHENDWQLHVEGCLGECALAKHMGVYWSGKGIIGAPEVGVMDVRTAARDSHRLILHESDDDDRVFWLLCGLNGRYRIKGWILGRDGKKPEYWEDPGTGRPAYFVPQSALNSPGKTER